MNPPTTKELKARAQKLKPVIHVGHDGVNDAVVAALDKALSDHGLVKVRFTDHKTERKPLAALMEQRTGARRILLVGHTVTLYRAPLDKSDQL